MGASLECGALAAPWRRFGTETKFQSGSKLPHSKEALNSK